MPFWSLKCSLGLSNFKKHQVLKIIGLFLQMGKWMDG